MTKPRMTVVSDPDELAALLPYQSALNLPTLIPTMVPDEYVADAEAIRIWRAARTQANPEGQPK